MASRRFLIDTVVLFNYVGEVNDRATYQETILKRCYCPATEGASINGQGNVANDTGRLYIFDAKTQAVSAEGQVRTFLPFDEWRKLDDKSGHWTLCDKGTDYFRKEGCAHKLRITSFAHKMTGTRRMWHYEVDAR